MVAFTLNGEAVTASDAHPHLLAALRDELGVISPKDGCSPTGQCGCCAVLVDGKARVACQTSMERAAGTEITTIEGLDPAEVERMAAAFAACGALQCGFCTPGIVIRTKSLIDRKGAELERSDAARHLGGHLCRSTARRVLLPKNTGFWPLFLAPGPCDRRVSPVSSSWKFHADLVTLRRR